MTRIEGLVDEGDGPHHDDDFDPSEERHVTGLLDAEWHMSKIRSITRERDQALLPYDQELARLTARRDDIDTSFERRIRWHADQIESWHRAHPDTRTLKLPSGTVKLTVPKQPKVWLDPADDGAARAVELWARDRHPELLRAPLITAIRDVVTPVETDTGWQPVDAETGEVVDGLHAAVPEATWSFRVEDGDSPW